MLLISFPLARCVIDNTDEEWRKACNGIAKPEAVMLHIKCKSEQHGNNFGAVVFFAFAAFVEAASCAVADPEAAETPSAAAPTPAVKVPKKARRVEFRFIFSLPLLNFKKRRRSGD